MVRSDDGVGPIRRRVPTLVWCDYHWERIILEIAKAIG